MRLLASSSISSCLVVLMVATCGDSRPTGESPPDLQSATPAPKQDPTNPPSSGPSFAPGMMMAFAGPTPPTGWLLCDGHAVSKMEYPDLFNAVGSSWGDGGDGDGPLFNLPDTRGMFLRGVDSGAKRDPEADARAALTQGGNAGDRVGSAQDAATAPPKKAWSATTSSGADWDYGGSGSRFYYATEPRLSTLTVTGGDVETRPKNVAVNWIVKY